MTQAHSWKCIYTERLEPLDPADGLRITAPPRQRQPVFVSSTGSPSEAGLLTDALNLADFAMKTAGISPERIVIFGQSLGTAVSISLAHHLALQSPPVLFAGIVLVAPFANVEPLTQTYSVAGTIPLLAPIAKIPGALAFFNKFIVSKWPSKDKLAALIRHCEALKQPNRNTKYDITLVHAEDDYDIPWVHSEVVFWHAVNATRDAASGLTFEELEKVKNESKLKLGAGGWEVEWRSKGGVIREQIVKHGLHDQIMSYPVVSLAVARAFHSQDRASSPEDCYVGVKTAKTENTRARKSI
ncbi:hypothetical protein LTR10_022750 [Elasticomyces elasticus]|uniref:AB hydrolase-1 domain-containing protein n=1 Tax=Exophiala sideris TaxID=1016849 RepID=A0ABR0JNC0_9EURO|nr:hypothetical protein LTR10_022750 [Elasticomyces elasticus]KAK5037981.1 hypothetical protein LTS07_001448 [Exophiala sideris]KAK5043963.1 hypothetical protein LTR13_000318 [Exophiala sideris]KAK5067462.1 hypothetical protein LTR69_001450 [Exophiala sideris]KAK5184302.1 hypothetical protein LTR44_003809 [Eurotiomycetes sp. CCFEE 6388]